MQPIPESVFKKEPPHDHFGLGILAPDPAHVVASDGGFVDVGHAGGKLSESELNRINKINRIEENIWNERMS